MQKATYNRKMKAFISGKGFVRSTQAKLRDEVIGFAVASLKFYKESRDVSHVTATTIALTQYNPKWVRAYHKACKDLLALHNAFELVIVQNDAEDFKYTWKFGKIAKDKRPQHLPSLERTEREMTQAFADSDKPKPQRTPEQVALSAIKRTTTALFDTDAIRTALPHLGLEDKRLFINIYRKFADDVEATLTPKRVAVKRKKTAVKAKATAKKATTVVGKALEKAAAAA